MQLKGQAYIVGAYEHPTRHAVDKSLGQLHAEVAAGALADAGLSWGTWMATSARVTCRAGRHKGPARCPWSSTWV